MHYFVPSSAGSSCASWCWRNWKNSRVSLVAAATQGTEQKLGCGGPCLDNRGVCPHHKFIIFCIIWVLFLPRSMGSSAHTSPARILCLHTGQQESPLAQNHECCWPELFEADFKVDLKSYFWLLVLIIIPQTWGVGLKGWLEPWKMNMQWWQILVLEVWQKKTATKNHIQWSRNNDLSSYLQNRIFRLHFQKLKDAWSLRILKCNIVSPTPTN